MSAPADTAAAGVAPEPAGDRLGALHFARFVFLQSGRGVWVALAFLLLSGLTEGASLLLLIPLLQGMAGGAQAAGLGLPIAAEWLDLRRVDLMVLLSVYAALVMAQAWFNRFKSIYTADMLYGFINRLRLDLFASISRARWRFLAQKRGSDLDHALTADIDRVQNATYQLIMLVQSCVMLGLYSTLAFLVSAPMTLFACVLGVSILLLLRPINRRAAAYGEVLTRQRQDQYRTVSEFLVGMKLARSFNAESRYVRRLGGVLEDMRVESVRYVRLSSTSSLIFQAATVLGLVAFVYVALRVFALPLPKIIVMALIFMRVSPRFTGLQTSVQDILMNLAAFNEMRRLQAQCLAEAEPPEIPGAAAPTLSHSVRFEKLSFRFPTSAGDVLSEIDCEIPARHITALIGASGSGKSTLVDLAMGLLEPGAGEILIDGVPLDGGNRRSWRDQLAYVPQDVLLLHDTLAENLRLGAPAATEDEMWDALRASSAAAFVERLPEGLDTVMGDRGLRLSGGERQRIALARALLRKPRLLILDEATSALDWENQLMISRAIESLRGRLTVITIAHRPSMIAFADWVVALQDGRVIEAGPYAQLIARDGSRLHQLLSGEFDAVKRRRSPSAEPA